MFRRAKVFATQIEVKLTFSIGTTLFTALYLPSIKQIVQPHLNWKKGVNKNCFNKERKAQKGKGRPWRQPKGWNPLGRIAPKYFASAMAQALSSFLIFVMMPKGLLNSLRTQAFLSFQTSQEASIIMEPIPFLWILGIFKLPDQSLTEVKVLPVKEAGWRAWRPSQFLIDSHTLTMEQNLNMWYDANSILCLQSWQRPQLGQPWHWRLSGV